MLDGIPSTNILFFDIETVSASPSFAQLDEPFQELWRYKAKSITRQPDLPDEAEAADVYGDKAAIYAEFGKIVCISVGILAVDKSDQRLRVRLKSFASEDEAALLADFAELLNKRYHNPHTHYLCGHNIREFDVPYICRRMVVQGVPLPAALDIAGKKPWECKHFVDTMELWKFGDFKSFVSLKLLSALLGFPSPKDDIDGSEVGRVFWEEKDLSRIARYCEKDVLATIQLYMRYRNEPLIGDDQVILTSED
jgi:hypothetical protein